MEDTEAVKVLALAEALYDYTPQSNDGAFLAFKKGDVFPVVSKADNGWWEGHVDGLFGWFPSNFVTALSPAAQKQVDPATIRLSNDDAKELLASLARQDELATSSTPATSSSKGSGPAWMVRAKAGEEAFPGVALRIVVDEKAQSTSNQKERKTKLSPRAKGSEPSPESSSTSPKGSPRLVSPSVGAGKASASSSTLPTKERGGTTSPLTSPRDAATSSGAGKAPMSPRSVSDPAK